MSKDFLNEREFELVNIIGAKLGSNQRDLSHRMNLSLGQTNMLIRRLVSKGYIRISQLSKKKVKYLLTPKGFTEKMRKSVKYTINTINSIGLIKNKVRSVIQQLYQSGERKFFILGDSDLVILVEKAFKESAFDTCVINHGREFSPGSNNAVILVCTEKFNKADFKDKKYVNLIEELAQDHEFVQFGNGMSQQNQTKVNSI
jgi:DNA-binding MarR family transcriptional regulator